MNNQQKEIKKRQFVKMLSEGLTQRQAAQELGISERTAGTWKKNLPFSHFLNIRDGIIKRIEKMIIEEAPAIEITNLSNALTGIQKTIDRQIKTLPQSVLKKY